MALDVGIKSSQVSQKFLHSNATSHTWPFSGIAELIEILYSCDFENDMCGWGNKPGETANWTRTSFDDKSVTSNFMDHTTGSGHYVYVESELTVQIPHIALLVSPNFTFDGENCLSMWYTKDNFSKAELFVFQYYENHTKEEVSLLHQQESTFQEWRRVQADITSTAGYWIEMYGTLKTVGDTLGVDDITVVNGTCPKEYILDGYIGCYDDNTTTMTMLSKSHTNNGEECRRKCKFRNYKFAGTRKSECYCDNTLDDLIPGTACDMSCPGNEPEICGGGNGSRSIYTTTMSIKTESDELSAFGLDKTTLLFYVFLSASSCALITAVIAVSSRIVMKRRRAKTSRTLNTKTIQPALLELNTNERQPEHVINDDEVSPYNYISLDTVNTPEDDNYSTVAIDKTTQCNVHSCKKPHFTTIVNHTFDRVQVIITVEKNMGEDTSNKKHHTGNSNQQNDKSGKIEESLNDRICVIIPDTSTDEDFQPADGYESLNHFETNENKTSNESASEKDTSIQSPGVYESFVERKPLEYSEVHLDTSGKLCFLEKEADKDPATEDDKKETGECHDYYFLEKH